MGSQETQTAIEGIGLGFRIGIADAILTSELPELRWLEVHPENYVGRGGRFRHRLAQARERFALVTHGLTLGFGALQPPDPDYVAGLREFVHEIGTPFHSEHLCFSGVEGAQLHDLLPLPFTAEAAAHAAGRVIALRDALGLPVAIENVSYYADPAPPEMDEVSFLTEVATRADARLLLDVNNVWVNAHNHGFDARAYIDRVPLERVVQLHVAGHFTRPDGMIIDTHGEAIRDEVYELLDYTLRRTGPVPVLLERDQNYPPFQELADEVRRLHAIYTAAVGAHANSTASTATASVSGGGTDVADPLMAPGAG